MNINYFPYVHSHLDNLFTLVFMLQFLKYAEDMNSQVFAELPTSTVVSATSLLEETLVVELHLGANISETLPDFNSLTAKCMISHVLDILFSNYCLPHNSELCR